MKLSTQQIEAILASMGEGLLVVDKNYKIVLMNDAAGFMLKVAPAEAKGKDLQKFFRFYKEGRLETDGKKLLEQAMNEINIKHIRPTDNYCYKDNDGNEFALAMAIATLIVHEKISGVVILFRDVSYEKQIDRAKTEFLDIASHQLRTPLSSVNWYTELLLNEEFGKINEGQKKCLNEVQLAGQTMADLINVFLNTSRIELGKIAIEPEPTDLAELLDAVIKEMELRISERRQELTKEYSKSLPIMKLDPQIMRVVLHNLISNAIKYTPDKGEIIVAVVKEVARVVIKVTDNGYGIPENQQKHVFEKAFRGKNIEDRDIGGHGFGLYIVKSLLSGSGGEIWFKSKEDEGTTFFVALPLEGMKKRTGIKHLD